MFFGDSVGMRHIHLDMHANVFSHGSAPPPEATPSPVRSILVHNFGSKTVPQLLNSGQHVHSALDVAKNPNAPHEVIDELPARSQPLQGCSASYLLQLTPPNAATAPQLCPSFSYPCTLSPIPPVLKCTAPPLTEQASSRRHHTTLTSTRI